MKREKKLFYFILLVLLLLNPVIAMAQEGDTAETQPAEKKKLSKYHSLGDNSFIGGVGILFPLGFTDMDGQLLESRLEVGVFFNVGFDFYLTPDFRIGARLSPGMAYTPNQNILYIVPLTIRATYEFQPIRSLSIPIYLGIGPSFNSYSEEMHIDFILRPGFGIYWNRDSTWSFGVDCSYWFIPQLYNNPVYSRIGHFIELTACIKYNT